MIILLIFAMLDAIIFSAIFHSKTKYDQMIDDKAQLEFLKEWRKAKLKSAGAKIKKR